MCNKKIEYECCNPNNIIHGPWSIVTDLIDNLEIEFKMSQQRLVVLFWIFFFFFEMLYLNLLSALKSLAELFLLHPSSSFNALNNLLHLYNISLYIIYYKCTYLFYTDSNDNSI